MQNYAYRAIKSIYAISERLKQWFTARILHCYGQVMKQIDTFITKTDLMWEGNFQPKYLIIENIIKKAPLANDNVTFFNLWWLTIFFSPSWFRHRFEFLKEAYPTASSDIL